MVRTHHRMLLRSVTASCLLMLCTLPAHAFEQLNAAQTLIYETGHLGNTHEGDVIEYRYEATDTGAQEVTDVATLTIAKSLPEGRRDVEVNFLTDSRHLPLPAFPGFRGNPIVMAMFEHVAQTMGADTGGGTLYFRNRIRDALADQSITIKPGKIQYAEQDIETSSITFSPFTNDPYLEPSSVLRNSLFTVQFSDEVPAGIVAIAVTASSGEQQFNRILSLQ